MKKQSEITYEKIKSLEIQGAMNVAKSALVAMSQDIINFPDENPEKFLEILSSARPNEPMLRNMLRLFLSESRGLSGEAQLRDLANSILEDIEKGEKKIYSLGAQLIHDGMKVFTHCHSSTAVGVLKEAKNQGKKFTVFTTETRPRYQGRITARELANAGIEVFHMVDSAAKYALDGADIFIFGADSILPSGYLINKVGTGIFCVVASKYDVPTYCATHTMKIVTDRIDEAVEERDPKEVWEDAPEGVKIKNPAFEKIHLKYVTAFITEKGLLKDILK
ncbi:MAG: translation initiation factor eIF-2B [Acidobacteria bacterium]|nr:translation initiation factor eIF-2B [Acidobacteriota bacterium]